MSDRLRGFIRDRKANDRDAAVRTLTLLGVDVLDSPDEMPTPLLYRSDAYLVAYAEARLDEWDPDQPRDEFGKWTSAGAGTVEGAVKAGQSAISKAENNVASIMGLAKKLEGSKVLKGAAAAQLYQALADKAKGLDNPNVTSDGKKLIKSLVDKYEGKAKELAGAEASGGSTTVATATAAAAAAAASAIKESEKKAEEALKAAGFSDSKELYEKASKVLGKPATVLEHGKEARDAAKKIVEHAKQLRAQYKKNPSPELKKKLDAATKAAKAARAAARKAEKAKSADEAKKHAEKAKSHYSKLVGGDDEAAAYVVSKAPKASAKDPGADPKLAAKTEKLLEQAKTPHPDNWTPEKIAAKQFALEQLQKHGNPKTVEEYKAAAAAFKEVASKASAAGSLWGSSYNDLADEFLDKVTPQETFEVGKTASGDHNVVPSKSARPIDSIKGEVIPEKTFKKHREDYTATLTSKEKSAALAYSGSSYTTINAHLRAGKPPTEQMLNLDKAIAKSPAPKDMIVHRGMSGSFVEKLFAGLEPGDQFVEKAYTSTSAGGSAAFGGSVEMHITVPKGYPIAPIPSHHPHEREYLLRRNTRYQVTKIEKTKSKYGGDKYVAHVTVVHDKLED